MIEYTAALRLKTQQQKVREREREREREGERERGSSLLQLNGLKKCLTSAFSDPTLQWEQGVIGRHVNLLNTQVAVEVCRSLSHTFRLCLAPPFLSLSVLT